VSRLVVVSNRVASPKSGKAPGGLAVGVLAALKKHGGIWFGWSGQTSEHEPGNAKVVTSGKIRYATIDISEQDYDAYYNGFSNNTLWPLFHSLLGFFSYSRSQFSAYWRVNELFARRLRALLEPDDLIWVHDYHLIPLAAELKQAGIRQPIGFFLHVPFPSFDLMRALPCYENIFRALAAYDVVGFQTRRDLWSFHDCLRQREIGGRVLSDSRVEAFGRQFIAESFPIGIDVEQCQTYARENIAHAQVTRLADSLRGRRLIIGVDRLDYSKGLELRFRAIEELLSSYPTTRGHVSYLQIAPPTRAEIRTYQDIRESLEQASGNINGQYAEVDWVPIRYLNKAYSRGVIMALLRLAKIGLVTPIRDGMNLVAKEFLASQDPEDPGVLVLSRLCGAAEELTDAVLINPYDKRGVADGLQTAIEMPLEERRERHAAMLGVIKRNDIHSWCRRFIDALDSVDERQRQQRGLEPSGRSAR
jgi:trehalose 6-phosphate synthase